MTAVAVGCSDLFGRWGLFSLFIFAVVLSHNDAPFREHLVEVIHDSSNLHHLRSQYHNLGRIKHLVVRPVPVSIFHSLLSSFEHHSISTELQHIIVRVDVPVALLFQLLGTVKRVCDQGKYPCVARLRSNERIDTPNELFEAELGTKYRAWKISFWVYKRVQQFEERLLKKLEGHAEAAKRRGTLIVTVGFHEKAERLS
jgi:hypothetical protein